MVVNDSACWNMGTDRAPVSPCTRAPGHHHLRLHTNCCNANGPRGWLCVLDRAFTAEGDAATVDFYMSGVAEAEIGDRVVGFLPMGFLARTRARNALPLHPSRVARGQRLDLLHGDGLAARWGI